MKAFFLFILLLVFIISSCAAGRTNGINKNAMKLASPQEVITTKLKVRKLLSSGVDVLDYHGAEANPVHDPGKGKNGGRAANP